MNARQSAGNVDLDGDARRANAGKRAAVQDRDAHVNASADLGHDDLASPTSAG